MKRYASSIVNLMHHPEPKESIFPYHYYDAEHGLFFNKQGSVGFILETNPIIGVDAPIVKQLSLLFDELLPQNSTLQFLLMSSADITKSTRAWASCYQDQQEVLKHLAAKRTVFFDHLAHEGTGTFRVKQYRLFVAYAKSMPYNPATTKSMGDFRLQLEQQLSACGMPTARLDVQELLNLVHEILAPGTPASTYDPLMPIASQMGTQIKVGPHAIEHGRDSTSKCYTLIQSPKEGFHMEGMIHLLGDGNRIQIPGRMILSTTISKDISEKGQAVLQDKGESVITFLGSMLARMDVRIRDEAEQWQHVEQRVHAGKKFLTTSFVVMLTAPTPDFDRAEQSLQSLYVLSGFKIRPTDYVMLLGLLSVLPFGAASGLLPSMKRFALAKTSLSDEPLAFLPIHGEWKGNSDTGMLFAGRRGQIMSWNPFYGAPNYNVSVIGQSGSGKSVLMQEMITNLVASGTRVFVLDIGRSYQKLCTMLGEEFIEFDGKKDLCLNPFSHVRCGSEKEEEDFLSYVLPILAKMAAPKRGTTDSEDALLARMLHTAWKKHRNQTSIGTLVALLKEEHTAMADELARMLFPYSEGSYSRYFNGEASITFTGKLTVIEFEELRERPDLLAVIMQMMSVQIMAQIFSGTREQRYALVFDEAWMCLDLFPDLLRNLAKTVRKYHCGLMLATQSFADFFKNDVAATILDNMSWRLSMQQAPSSYQYMARSQSQGGSISEGEIALMKTLEVVPGSYSECLISSDKGYVVGRLMLDPFSRMLFSTAPKEFNAVQKKVASGMSVAEAVSCLVEEMDA